MEKDIIITVTIDLYDVIKTEIQHLRSKLDVREELKEELDGRISSLVWVCGLLDKTIKNACLKDKHSLD